MLIIFYAFQLMKLINVSFERLIHRFYYLKLIRTHSRQIEMYIIKRLILRKQE